MLSSPPTRRRVLAALAGAGAFAAGCLSDPGDGSSGSTATGTTTTTRPTTTTSTSDGTEFPPDVDERVETQPPGSPALDPSGSWPAPRFDAGNTGYNPDGAGVRDGEPYWRLDAGGPAVVGDGTLYNVHGRDRDRRALTCRDPATAAVTTERPLVQYGVNVPPVLADGRVFVTTFIEAFCFDAASGERRWRGPKMGGIQAPPAVHDGTAFVNSGGFKSSPPHLRAFDAATGEEQWRYDTGEETKGTPALVDGLVFLVSEAGLHAVNAASGAERYVVDDEVSPWVTPVASDGTVYLVSGDDDRELVAVETTDGSVRWRRPVEGRDPPVVAGDVAYARTTDGLAALDVADGSVSRTFGGNTTPVARVGDVLYGTADGGVRAFDATTGEALWSFRTEEVQISDTIGRRVYHVTPVDDAVYVSARDAFYGVGPR